MGKLLFLFTFICFNAQSAEKMKIGYADFVAELAPGYLKMV